MWVHKACLRKTLVVKPHKVIFLSQKEKAYFAEKQIISQYMHSLYKFICLTEIIENPQLLIWCSNQEITIAWEINIAVYYL